MTTDAARQLFAAARVPFPDAAPPPPLPAGPSPWERKEEEKIHRAIMDWLAQRGWLYLRARMDKRSPFPVGWPDFTVFLPNGRTVFLEVKTPTGKFGPLQLETLHALEDQGFSYTVPRSDLEAIEFLRRCAAISTCGVAAMQQP